MGRGVRRWVGLAARGFLVSESLSQGARGRCGSVALGPAGRREDPLTSAAAGGGRREGIEGHRGASVGGSRVVDVDKRRAAQLEFWIAGCGGLWIWWDGLRMSKEREDVGAAAAS